jgi:hypothetical protein
MQPQQRFPAQGPAMRPFPQPGFSPVGLIGFK